MANSFVCCAQVKILATSLQMLSLFANEDSYPVSSPPMYADFMDKISVWARAPLRRAGDRACLFRTRTKPLIAVSSWATHRARLRFFIVRRALAVTDLAGLATPALQRQANVDIWSFFNMGCVVRTQYLNGAMLRVIVPLSFLVCCGFGIFVFTKLGRDDLSGACAQVAILFTFLIYVSTTNGACRS